MPTNNPVPSRDPSDLPFNAEKLDQVVNGTEPTFTDRKGVVRKTLIGFQADMSTQVAQVTSARNTAINVTIPAAVASVESARVAAVPEIAAKVANIDAIVVGATDTIARNIGTRATDPTTRLNGAPLQNGDYYFNTVGNGVRVYASGVWSLVPGATAADIANATDLTKGTSLSGHEGQSARAAINKSRAGMPLAGAEPFELFDRADGTAVQGLVTVSGHTLGTSGPAAATATVTNGGLSVPSTSGIYTGLTSSNLVVRVGGVFSWDATAATNAQPVIMFNGGPTNTTLDKLIHIEVAATSIVGKVTTTGAANLAVFAGTVTERNGKENTGFYLKDMRRDGTKYPIVLEFTQGSSAAQDVFSIYMPDGRILDYTGETKFRDVMASCYHGTWQVTGAGARWHRIWIGRDRAGDAAAMGGAQPAADSVEMLGMSRFWRTRRCSFQPTASGWYKIADEEDPNTSFSAIVGTLRILGRDNGGRNAFAECHINSFGTEGVQFQLLKTGFGNLGGYNVSKVRISRDGSATGSKQLEVFVENYSNPADRVTIEFDGVASVVAAPVVGSTALSGFSTERFLPHDVNKRTRNETATTAKTFTPGVDYARQILTNHYGAAVDFSIDNASAITTDEYWFARSAGFTNNAVLKNLSDGSTITTLAPGSTALLGVVSGKFVVISKGTC